MILINLLPAEYRQKKRTPAKFMAGIAAVVAVNASLVAWWSWVAFGEAAQVKNELEVLHDSHSGLEAQVSYHEALAKEAEGYTSREGTLQKITSRRLCWTSELDDLVDIVTKGGDGDRYLVWFEDLNFDTKENTRNKTFGSFEAKGRSGSTDFAHVASFLEDLEQSELMTSFTKPAPAEAPQKTVDESMMPSVVWAFPLEMAVRSPEERKQR